jgi:RNA polymerase sigma-70 factor (ECF subfamily)
LDLQLLIRAAQKGDERAFEALLTQFNAVVYRCVYALLGNAADAEDVTQEVFIRLWRTLPRYRFEASFHTYLSRMARNAAMDHLRREKRRPDRPRALPVDTQADEIAPPVADPSPENNPVANYLSQEKLQILYAALAALPVEMREIVVLHSQMGHSYEEISKIMVLPIGTVRSRLHRAKKLLLKFLENGNFFE